VGTFPFLKGHGTENDFVVLPDPDGTVHGSLAPELVAALCDRRSGIGGDGVLRAIRCAAYDDPASVAARPRAEWFMDYRNADGSTAEMCGNGLRVFARYLVDHQGQDAADLAAIGTREGVRQATVEAMGQVTVEMGTPRLLDPSEVRVGERRWAARNVSTGNPHAVVFVESLDDAGDLRTPPSYDVAVYPDGVNIEFVERRGEQHIALRVHERGSGETRSCGTGACAAVVAAAIGDGLGPGVLYRVDVPGGTLEVTWTPANTLLLTGPAVIVASGEVDAAALSLGKPVATDA
jgi:diaminopimelate epimerase